MESESSANSTAIAIIGISCRFPQAKTPDAFWQNLRDGVECVTEFSKEDLVSSGIDPSIINYPSYINNGIILEDLELFDASFFGFSTREAEVLDPQHRIFLECAWEAMENAGYDANSCKGSLGVYGGVDLSSYEIRNIYANEDAVKTISRAAIKLGNDKDHLTSRVAQKLNFKGPAVTVQTTCSTSLVAIIQACQSLLNFQCDMALAGGSGITLLQKMGYFYQEGGISSPDGHCRAFDAKARGTTGGSGAGVLVLKRLEEALNEGDHIEAVIRGFGINNDGSRKVGFTAPSIVGQSEAIAAAIAMADIDAESISYVEAHGTGTLMGDPIEISALTQVFRQSTLKKRFCGIGSVKTNIGHCNSAAGAAGIIKAILSLKNRMLAPSLNFTHPNPNIDFANSPFYVVSKLEEWNTTKLPRRAGVSSFGIGGTNGHVILEEAPPLPDSGPSRKWQLIMLSAKTSGALHTMSSNIINYLKNASHPLPDIAYTLQIGRRRFEYRSVLLLQDEGSANPDDLFGLERISNNEKDRKSVVFMFPGEGAQHINMALGIYRQETVFKDLIDFCCDYLIGLLELDLRKVIYTDNPFESERLKQSWLAQPALFVIEYALARLWMSWGVKPEAMIGYGVGELVAACLAGVFSIEEALKLVVFRGRSMQAGAAEAMLEVQLSQNELTALLDHTLSIAAVNTPSSCVVSGPIDSIQSLEQLLAEQGTVQQPPDTFFDFHSNTFDNIADPFSQVLESINLHSPQIPFLSNVTGNWITTESATNSAYWQEQMLSTIQFSRGMTALLKDSSRTYVEVGPGNRLCNLLHQHCSKQEAEIAFTSLSHPDDKQPDEKNLINTLAQLWLAGVAINWSGYYEYEKRQRVALPTYPFERERYWIDAAWKPGNGNNLPEKKKDISQWIYKPYWKLSALPSEAYYDNLNPLGQSWLVFSDTNDTGASFISRLVKGRQIVYNVLKSDEFVEIDEHNFGIDPNRSDHYSLLLERLLAIGTSPDTIVYLWNFNDTNNGEPFERNNGSSYFGNNNAAYLSGTDNFFHLLYIAQALSQNNNGRPVQMKVVSNHMHQLHELEKIEPRKAVVLDACRIITHEFPNVKCQSVDISVDIFTPDATSELIGHLLEEFAFTSPDPIVLYRNGKRWIQSFKPVAAFAGAQPKNILREEGAYLITTGLRGLGLELAKYIGEKYKAKLVISCEPDLPAEQEWDNYLSEHTNGDAISYKLRNIRQLQEAGADVMVVTADMTDPKQMKDLAARIKDRFGKLNGIVHAGVPGGGISKIREENQGREVIDPKMKSTLILQEIFGNNNLDFFVLCSSFDSIVKDTEQADDSVANNFFDAFAHQRNSRFNTRYISIHWDAWSYLPMQIKTEADKSTDGQQVAVPHSIRNAEGVELFERILASHLPQVLVSTKDIGS